MEGDYIKVVILFFFLNDENIGFINRKDMQVMKFGKRVEPIEINTVINMNSNFRQSIVLSFSFEII